MFRYAEGSNPNGAMNDIAGIVSESGTVIGMMPHPENMIEPLHGKTDCRRCSKACWRPDGFNPTQIRRGR